MNAPPEAIFGEMSLMSSILQISTRWHSEWSGPSLSFCNVLHVSLLSSVTAQELWAFWKYQGPSFHVCHKRTAFYWIRKTPPCLKTTWPWKTRYGKTQSSLQYQCFLFSFWIARQPPDVTSHTFLGGGALRHTNANSPNDFHESVFTGGRKLSSPVRAGRITPKTHHLQNLFSHESLLSSVLISPRSLWAAWSPWPSEQHSARGWRETCLPCTSPQVTHTLTRTHTLGMELSERRVATEQK